MLRRRSGDVQQVDGLAMAGGRAWNTVFSSNDTGTFTVRANASNVAGWTLSAPCVVRVIAAPRNAITPTEGRYPFPRCYTADLHARSAGAGMCAKCWHVSGLPQLVHECGGRLRILSRRCC